MAHLEIQKLYCKICKPILNREEIKTAKDKHAVTLWLTVLLVGTSGCGSVRPGGFRCIAFNSISAFILAKSLLYAVKQPVQRHTVHIPLPSTLIFLTCKKNIKNVNYNDTAASF